MTVPTATTRPAPTGLAALSRLGLNAYHQAFLDTARQTCGGPPACCQRKLAEAHDLLALAELSGRLDVHSLDLAGDLRAKVRMRVPAPCRPDPDGPLRVAPFVLLGVIYPERAAILPQPGYAFIRILAPGPIWHSNVSPDPNQVLCLGPSLPAGIPLKEIILMTYGALTMQATQLDPGDPAGVLHPEAAEWWQRNPQLIPLTVEPFLPWEVKHGN